MSDLSPILSLPLLQASQAQKHVTHNEALMQLDLLVQLTVADRTRTAPRRPPARSKANATLSPPPPPGLGRVRLARSRSGWTGLGNLSPR